MSKKHLDANALVLAVALGCGPFVPEASAQVELLAWPPKDAAQASPSKHSFGVFGTALTPIARLFYSESATDEDQIDPFPKNIGGLGFQLVGVDLGYFYDQSFGVGVSPSIGISEHDGAGVTIGRLAGFVQAWHARVEFGKAWAVSNDSELSKEQRWRYAWFIGVSLPRAGLKAGEALMSFLATENENSG